MSLEVSLEVPAPKPHPWDSEAGVRPRVGHGPSSATSGDRLGGGQGPPKSPACSARPQRTGASESCKFIAQFHELRQVDGTGVHVSMGKDNEYSCHCLHC